MNWNIVMDSSCDLKKSRDSFKNANLEIAPLAILVGDKEFIDEEEVDVDALLHAMKQEKRASSSACPSPDAFYQAFVAADCSICITMTAALSGTNNSAQLAKKMLAEDHPEKKVHIIDSRSTAGDMILLARKADILIGEGLSFEEICTQLDAYNQEIKLVFTLMQFDNLIKTGRMKPITGMIASRLGIRVIAINTEKGEIQVIQKQRGEDKTLAEMVEYMCKTKDMTNKPVVINHCKNPEAIEKLKQLIMEKCNTKDITVVPCKALTTFYSMEKGILISY